MKVMFADLPIGSLYQIETRMGPSTRRKTSNISSYNGYGLFRLSDQTVGFEYLESLTQLVVPMKG